MVAMREAERKLDEQRLPLEADRSASPQIGFYSDSQHTVRVRKPDGSEEEVTVAGQALRQIAAMQRAGFRSVSGTNRRMRRANGQLPKKKRRRP